MPQNRIADPSGASGVPSPPGYATSLERLTSAIRNIETAIDGIEQFRLEDVDRALQPPPRSMIALLKQLAEMRRRKAEGPNADLFSDPAWDMLTDLMMASLSGRVEFVSDVCIASNVPTTTALRWLSVLVDRGLATRHPDARDSRRVIVAITPAGENLVRRIVRGEAEQKPAAIMLQASA